MASVIEVREDAQSIEFPSIELKQNIGVFYSGVMSAKNLIKISWVDVRRIESETRGFETYLGIQRPLDDDRVKKIAEYVTTKDACFPTSIILSVPQKCAEYGDGVLKISNYQEDEEPRNNLILGKVASVLDGQHRIEGMRLGLSDTEKESFFVPVSIFVDIDLAEQAYIFSTVNLAQTKVSKSLVYDLFDLAKAPSPQKAAHNIAVIMDKYLESPLSMRIKRLGSATPGRFGETITQAAFVESLLDYLTPNANKDRDIYLRGRKPELADYEAAQKHIFRNMMIEGKENEIAEVILNYFSAVKKRWPAAWDDMGKGNVLNKTNGFKALMRFLRPSYLKLTSPGGVPKVTDFSRIFGNIGLRDEDFVIENYPPGTSGQSRLYQDFMRLSGLDRNG